MSWLSLRTRRLMPLLLIVGICLAATPRCVAYSVLTHEEIIDLLWDQQIVPLLKSRFPNATPDEVKQAHAYAYGGSVIQDIGYYPWGNHVFSDLTHYVRTGDFVQAMIADSEDINQFAFALGALSHYIADIHGHPYINLAVGMEYPKLSELYGPSVPYDVDHAAHLKVEFGFDVLQVAKGRYAPEQFHDFIGFEVSAPLLERAFYDTYGIELKSVMPNEQLAINTYRRSVSKILPEMTKVALLTKGDELRHEVPNFNREHFLYHLSRADYRRAWGSGYKEPGPGAYIMATMFRALPKIGPLQAINFKEPTADTENMYFKSVNETIDAYGEALRDLKNARLETPNIDLDTGKPTRRDEYPLADATYRGLLDELSYDRFRGMSDPLRDNLVHFYDGFGFPQPKQSRLDHCAVERWHQTYVEVNQVRADKLLDQIASGVVAQHHNTGSPSTPLAGGDN
jgi:hypothetical protein